MWQLRWVVAVALLSSVSSGRAAPIAFDEAVSAPVKPFFTYRDFPDSISYVSGVGFSIGTLDTGANLVTGALHGDCVVIGPRAECNSTLGQDEQDSMLFTVPVATAISISVSTSGAGPSGFLAQISVRERNASDYSALVQLPLNQANVGVLAGILPAGLYDLTWVGRTASAAGAYSFSYAVAMVVPEPGTGLLVIAGLVGLAAWRRDRA